MKLGVMPEMQQHLQAMGLGESGNVGIEVWVTRTQFSERWNEFFIKHEAIAASVGSDDRHSFLQCQAESIGIAERLILTDQAEFVTDMAEKRQFPLSECSIERCVSLISRIEVLGVRQDFDQDGAGIGTAVNFIDGIFALRVDRGAGKKYIRIRSDGLEDVRVADEKVRMLPIEEAGLVVKSIHAEQHGFRNMLRGAQLLEKVIEIFLIGFPRMCR